MLVRLIFESFRRQRAAKLLAGAAIALGVCVATAMIAVATDIGDKINRELRTLWRQPSGHSSGRHAGRRNRRREFETPRRWRIPQRGRFSQIKGTFWRHNIVGFSPVLPVRVQIASAASSTPGEVLGTYFAKSLKFGDEDFTTGVRITHPWWKVAALGPPTARQDVLVGERLAQSLRIPTGAQIASITTRIA